MSIDTRLSLEDIKELITALEALELMQVAEFTIAKEILSIPEIPEDHPAYEYVAQLKEKFRGKEQVLADKLDNCKETCATLRAKLYFIKKEIGCDSLFNASENSFDLKDEEEVEKEDSLETRRKELQDRLKEAVEKEDYEKASQIKKELENLK